MATERLIAEGLPFRKYPQLCNIQNKNDVDLKKNYLTDAMCKRFISLIAETMKNELKVLFNACHLVSFCITNV